MLRIVFQMILFQMLFAWVVTGETPKISFLDSIAVVMEYQSVYDVHNPPVDSKPLRNQSGHFDAWDIIADLALAIDPNQFDFILMYSVPEVPGYIHSGPSFYRRVKNTGLASSLYDKPTSLKKWPRVRQAPHMNSVDLLAETIGLGNVPAILLAVHEMGHYWGAYWGMHRDSATYFGIKPKVTGKTWKEGDPVAWIVAGPFHWIPNFESPDSVGIMYNVPLSDKFNAFDLYAMGLMGYDEVSQYSYRVHTRGDPKREFDLTVDTLIYANTLMNGIWPGEKVFYEGDGRRIPDTDSTVNSLHTLIVIIKGKDDELTEARKNLVRELARDLPGAWNTATWGRSTMTANVSRDTNSSSVGPSLVQVALPHLDLQNTPNGIRFSLPGPGFTEMFLYDVFGRRRGTILSRRVDAGEHLVPKAKFQNAAGIYFVTLRAADEVKSIGIRTMR